MKKILVVFGTRPETIKICPLILEMRKRDGLEVFVMRDTMEETIYRTFKLLLEDKDEYDKMSRACNPYGVLPRPNSNDKTE